MYLAPRARIAAGLAVAATALSLALPAAAVADDAPTGLPQVSALSSTSGTTDCGETVTISGTGFTAVSEVRFGGIDAGYQVLSPTRLEAWVPAHPRAKVNVRVVTATGISPTTAQAHYAWVKQPLSLHKTRLNCGMTAAEAMANSAKFRRTASSHVVAPIRRSSHWTAAIGENAVRRAQAWTGLSYSWAGGGASGPSYGVNTSGGGWFDSKIWGFDCSGLTLYSWAPYKSMAHFAATQYKQAGRFHPTANQLMPGDLIFYSGNGHANGIEHVQMYIGGGQIIQAPESGYTIGTATLSTAPGRPFYAATRPLTRGAQGSAPQLTRLSRTAGPAGAPATVIAYGTGLGQVSTVLVSGVRTYDFTVLSGHRLKITLPAHDAGAVSVRIGGAWGVSNAERFSYLGAPTVTGLTPNQGPAATAQSVKISGTGFQDVTSVTVGGVAAPFTVNSTRTISATLPAMPAGAYPVVVTTKYGTSAGWTTFTYLPPVD
ncbi:MAG TPA: IPT/TIG domain-containing protein [Jatrophihabitantaceae bacterium]|jgi:cell wall-associated NlpC family hydrolase|nr:IPT/TIG domain-containing protein [Jatrophihabitantaceae bacterium]